jgi:CRP-like cAMP-binding protein
MNDSANHGASARIFEVPDRADEFAGRFPQQIRTMLAMLKMSRLGGLAVAECDDFGLRRQLFDYFRERLADEDIYLYPYEVPEDNLNLVRALQELTEQPRFKNLELTGRYKAIVIFVYGIEKYNPEQEAQFLHLLNFLRDAINRVEPPIIIWGTEAFITHMAREAPDFWSWKGMVFSFPATEDDQPITDTDAGRQAMGMGNRAPVLQRYLQAVTADSDFAIWRDLYSPLKAVRANDATFAFSPRNTLTEEEILELQQARFLSESYAAEETIFEYNTTGDKCYIIVSGEVEVLVPDVSGHEIVVSHLGQGDFFGEIALFQSTPRTATVRTTQPSDFIVITRRTLGRVSNGIVDVLISTGNRRLTIRMQDELVSPLRRFALEESAIIRQPPVDMRQIVADEQRVIILGEAGSGKTTVLRRIMLDMANSGLRAFVNQEDTAIIPFFIKLNMLAANRTVADLILASLRSYGISDYASREEIERLLNTTEVAGEPRRQFVFLMDNLNTLPNHADVRHGFARFARSHKNAKFVMTCRLQNYAPMAGFKTAVLQKLFGDDVQEFLEKYLGCDLGRQIAREIYSDSRLEELAQSPLALYMFAQIAKGRSAALPKNRGVLFTRFTENLLERTDTEWWKIFGRSRSRVPLELRRSVLASLALSMHQNQEWAFPLSEWLGLVNRELRSYRAECSPEEAEAIRSVAPQDIAEEIIYSGILYYSTDREWVEFSHHTLQEFFVALAWQNQEIDLEPLLRTTEDRRHWMGVIVMLYGISESKEDLFFKILGNGSDYNRIWLAAECLSNSGERIAPVANRLEVWLRAHPGDERQEFGTLFSIGLARRQMAHYSEALSYLNRAADLQPESADVQYELGSLYRVLDHYERAVAHLESAIRVRPSFVDAYNQLGITYYDQGKYVEALTVFRATTQLEPSNPYHYYNLGTILKVLRDYSAARTAFRQAVELKPDYLEARHQLEVLEKAMDSGVTRILERIPLLHNLTLEQSVLLAGRLKTATFEAGETVFDMGDSGDTFYIIETGEVEVLAPDMKDPSAVLNRLKAGDFFGEIALLRAVPRTATIRAVTQIRVLTLSREDFDEVLAQYPSVAHRLTETSGQRLLSDRHRGRRSNLDRHYNPVQIEKLVEQDEATVLIGDIHNSTSLSDAIGPELMVEFLDEYLTRMSTIIVESGGVMDRSLGDSVMAVFGSISTGTSDVEMNSGTRAVLAALRMRLAYQELCNEWKKGVASFAEVGMGIGLGTGKLTKGTVGTETAIVGKAISIANRLSNLVLQDESECEIYMDEKTCGLVAEGVPLEKIPPQKTVYKPVVAPLAAYRVAEL